MDKNRWEKKYFVRLLSTTKEGCYKVSYLSIIFQQSMPKLKSNEKETQLKCFTDNLK